VDVAQCGPGGLVGCTCLLVILGVHLLTAWGLTPGCGEYPWILVGSTKVLAASGKGRMRVRAGNRDHIRLAVDGSGSPSV
jgi:hypothetical protein